MLQPFNPQPPQQLPDDAPVQKPAKGYTPNGEKIDKDIPSPDGEVSPTVIAPG